MLKLKLSSVGQTSYPFCYLEVKSVFQETTISCDCSDFSREKLSLAAAFKLYPTSSLVLGDLDSLNLDKEHHFLYPWRWAVQFCNGLTTLTLLYFRLEILRKLKAFPSTCTHSCTAAKDTNLIPSLEK